MEILPVKMSRALLLLTLTFLAALQYCEGCSWKESDTPLPEPLYIKVNKDYTDVRQLLLPGKTEKTVVDDGTEIKFACPGEKNQLKYPIPRKSKEKILTCKNDKWEHRSDTYNFDQIKCDSEISVTNKFTDTLCGKDKNGEILKIGYQLVDDFIDLQETCFDKKSNETIYTKYFILSGVHVDVKEKKKDYSTKPNWFSKTILRNKDTYIIGYSVKIPAHGHFLKFSDFFPKLNSKKVHHDTTFFYKRSKAHWQYTYKENWDVLEEKCREFAVSQNKDLIIYTGTDGAISAEKNYKFHVPSGVKIGDSKNVYYVPKFYWKVVYDEKNAKGVAFAVLNDPYPSNTRDIDNLCPSICNKLHNWGIKDWKNTVMEKGLGICCTVEDMMKKINDIPQLNVNDILD